MPWAPPAPAHSSRRSWSSSRVFQPSFQLVEAPVPPEGDPQQPLAAMCQRPPAGGSAGHRLQGKRFPLDRLGASSSCICLQRKKQNPNLLFPSPSNHPELPGLQGNPRDTPDWSAAGAPAPSSSLIPPALPSPCHRGQIRQDSGLFATTEAPKAGKPPQALPKALGPGLSPSFGRGCGGDSETEL